MELRNLSCDQYAFDARKSQDSGQAVSYGWDFGDGQKSSEAYGVHTYVKSGNYRVKLTVTGVSTSETSQLIEINIPPQARFQVPALQCMLNELSLDASSSTVEEGVEASYHWDFGNGKTAEGKQVKYLYEKGGDYKITLTVDDKKNSDCSVSKMTADIHVDEAPVAMLNKVEPVCISGSGRKISFDASSSYDPEGKKLTYHWDFGDGTSHSGGSKVSHKYTKSGVYKIVVTVNDGSGTKCSAVKDKIHVKINRPPVLNAFVPMKGNVGTPVRFDGTQSYDPDGDGLTHFWYFGNGKNKAEGKASHTYKKKGKYKIVFTIDDNSGSPCSVEWEKYKLRIDDPLPSEALPAKK